MPTTDESTDAGSGDSDGEALTTGSDDDERGGVVRGVRRYGPFVAVGALLVVAAAVFGRGEGADDTDGAEPGAEFDHEALVLAGPRTPEQAQLVDEEFVPGPHCDVDTGRIMLPTVYAPPCVEPFEGDNGGATSMGVTEDTVKLVLYLPKEDFFFQMLGVEQGIDEEAARASLQGYIDLYGELFETYGRQVELEVVRGGGDATDEAQAQADAIAIAEKEPFAVIGGPFANLAFSDELAARGVVCLPGCATGAGLPDEFVRERAPYVWPDGMTGDQQGRIAGEAIGSLAGPDRPAELAGDPALRVEDRVYGLLRLEGSEAMRDGIAEGLREHGGDLAVDIVYSTDPGTVQEESRAHIVRLKEAGVTTVIVTGAPFTPGFLTNEATAQDYRPEWVLGPSFFADVALFALQTDQDQWTNGFGIAYKLNAHTTGVQAAGIAEWAYGDAAVAAPTSMPFIEPATRMLFTGIHLAGPELTPESFRDGLFRFPLSGDGRTSSTLSWGDHGIWPDVDYGTEDDVAIIWWSLDAENPAVLEDPEAPDYLAGPGLYALANGGQRYSFGEFPDSPEAAGLHDEESAAVMYTTPLPPDIEELFDRYDPPDLTD